MLLECGYVVARPIVVGCKCETVELFNILCTVANGFDLFDDVCTCNSYQRDWHPR